MGRIRILVTGASGQLGTYLLRQLSLAGSWDVAAWAGSAGGDRLGTRMRVVDLRQPDLVAEAFLADRPDVVIHAAAVCRVDVCCADPHLAQQVNVDGTRCLAELAARHRARLVYVSTDMVFDGRTGNYAEEDAANPLSRYGQSKLAGERAALEAPRAVVARVSLLFGPSLNGRPSFFDHQRLAIRGGQPITLFTDEWRTPLSLVTAARALAGLARSDVPGILHVGGPERMSRWEMGVRLARSLGCDAGSVRPGLQRDAPFSEPRPSDISLDASRWRGLFPDQPWPTWEAALRELEVA